MKQIMHITHSGQYGIGVVIDNIIKYISKEKFSCNILTLENNNSNAWQDYSILRDKIYNRLSKIDIIHVHGGWTLIFLIFRKKFKKPVIIAPHGVFHPVSLKKSRFKKFMAEKLYMNKAYKNATCIQASSKKDLEYIQSYGIRNIPIAIIPNGINIKEKLNFNENLRLKLLKLAKDKKIILSLSRLEEAKGIDILIESFYEVKRKNNKSVLFIVGKGTDKYEEKILHKIKEKNLENEIFLLGSMVGDDKNTIYDVADIFILPSFNESFPLTILEAARQKLPIITTTATPFSEIKDLKCGWYIKAEKELITKAIIEASNLSNLSLQEMGNNSYKLVLNKYNIDIVMKMYEELYDWLLYNNNKPDFVINNV
jgi:glycosyltransferase involved in cell wall biosynthesis